MKTTKQTVFSLTAKEVEEIIKEHVLFNVAVPEGAKISVGSWCESVDDIDNHEVFAGISVSITETK